MCHTYTFSFVVILILLVLFLSKLFCGDSDLSKIHFFDPHLTKYFLNVQRPKNNSMNSKTMQQFTNPLYVSSAEKRFGW